MSDQDLDLMTLTAEIVSAHVANNSIAAADVGALIGTVHRALAGLAAPAAAEPAAKPQPATSARKSVADPAFILSMIDGKPYKMLRRHIGQHGYTPESYRAAFDLPQDYPMVARDYAERRRALAHEIGLGRKPVAAVPAAEPAPVAEPAADPKPARAAGKPAAARRKLNPNYGSAVAAAKEHLGAE